MNKSSTQRLSNRYIIEWLFVGIFRLKPVKQGISLLGLPILFLSVSSCASTKTGVKSDDIVVLSATQQKWHGGRPESGSGINYEVKVVSPVDDIRFDTLYFPDTKIKIGILKGVNPTDQINAGDTLRLKAGKKLTKDIPTPIKSPIKIEGAAVVSYTVDGKTKYFQIKEFEKLEDLLYP